MTLRRFRILACACFAVLALALPGAAPQKRFAGRVVGIHDGDTISVLVGRRSVKVRLEGIDCPELSQPYGRVARLFTSDRVFGKPVVVVQTTVDRYGRSVGRVFVNGEDLSDAILAAGLAWHYTQYSSDRTLDAAEQSARAARRGLWSQPNPTPPWVFRRPRAGLTPPPSSRGRVAGTERATQSAAAPASRSLLPPAAVSGPFHGNIQSHVFHAPGCANYNCKNCTAVFATREDAVARGYKPAGDCLR